MTRTPTMTTDRPARRTPSARVRILLWLVLMVALALLLSLLLQRRLLLDRLDTEVALGLEQEVAELRQLAGGIDPLSGTPFGDDAAAILETFLSRNVPGEGEAFAAWADGQFIGASPGRFSLEALPMAERWATLTAPESGTSTTQVGEVRWVAVPLGTDADPGSGVFVAGNFMQTEQEEIATATATAAGVAVVLLLVTGGVGWVVAGQILSPVRQLTATAQRISESALDQRLTVERDDELGRLARTLNEMLDRLEGSFEVQRSFIADAGHELRTPITIIRGHLELMAAEDPMQREEVLALVDDELDRMGRMVNDLLLLAALERPDPLDLDDVGVVVLLDEVLTKARALGTRRWRLVTPEDIDLAVRADAHRLTQALLNLLRNAVEHAGPDATITLGATRTPRSVQLWVSDDGPGIPAEDRERVLQRFARGADRRRGGEGAGLGLAIAARIARLHGGDLTIDGTDGGGARIAVSLPLQPTAPTPSISHATDGRPPEVTPSHAS